MKRGANSDRSWKRVGPCSTFASSAMLLSALALSNASCTFYTACPTGNSNTSTAGTSSGGRASNNGGQSSGGASNNGGQNSGAEDTGGSMDMGPDPTGVFVNSTGNLATVADGGMDLSLISSVPGSKRIIAGMGNVGLWASDDAGETWSALGTGKGSDVINSRPQQNVYDPSNPDVFWMSGIYGSGVFRTDDAGETFKWLGALSHNDLVSIDFTDPERKLLLAGPHEQPQVLWRSTNGGDKWEDIGANLPPDTNFSTLPLIIDSQTFLLGSCGFGKGKCGVFRSTDGGDSWTIVSDKGPYEAPLWASDNTIYWALYNGGMIVSEDLGETWTETSPGPIKPYSPDLVELPDGRILALGKNFPLATDDKGKTWKKFGAPLPFPGENCGTYGLMYSAALNTLFVNHNDCSGHVLDNSLWSLALE